MTLVPSYIRYAPEQVGMRAEQWRGARQEMGGDASLPSNALFCLGWCLRTSTVPFGIMTDLLVLRKSQLCEYT